MAVTINNNVAYLSSGASVFMSSGSLASDFSNDVASPIIKEVEEKLNVHPWGEDNRFPQNIEKHIAACGVAKAALNFKSVSLCGTGLLYGTVEGYDANGQEIFKPAKLGEFPEVDQFMKRTNAKRYLLESAQAFVYFANTFTEAIFSKDWSKITRFVNQDSCDCRYKRMDKNGVIPSVYISKLWGLSQDQFVKYDPDKKYAGVLEQGRPALVDNEFVFERFCVDIYNPQDSLQTAVKQKRKSVIIPVNYPSPNKTYYQLAHWDGARLSGWIEIASKIPAMLKAMYNNGMTLRYHIEIPETYWEKKAGAESWAGMNDDEKIAFKNEELEKMDTFLGGSENAHKSFISYFDTDPITKKEYNQIKITPIEIKSNIDKDLLTSGTANSEIFFAMGINPNIFGAGQQGGVYGANQGGSNIREGKITHDTLLYMDRQLMLEPFYIAKDFNKWDDKLEFRFKDILLTTLDTGKQTRTQLA